MSEYTLNYCGATPKLSIFVTLYFSRRTPELSHQIHSISEEVHLIVKSLDTLYFLKKVPLSQVSVTLTL